MKKLILAVFLLAQMIGCGKSSKVAAKAETALHPGDCMVVKADGGLSQIPCPAGREIQGTVLIIASDLAQQNFHGLDPHNLDNFMTWVRDHCEGNASSKGSDPMLVDITLVCYEGKP